MQLEWHASYILNTKTTHLWTWERRVMQRPLTVWMVLRQYITEPQLGPQNISLWTCFHTACVHNTIFMKISQSQLHLHFKVALYSHGEDIKSHLPSNK